MPTPYHYLRCEDWRSPEIVEQRNSPLGLRDDDDEDVVATMYVRINHD